MIPTVSLPPVFPFSSLQGLYVNLDGKPEQHIKEFVKVHLVQQSTRSCVGDRDLPRDGVYLVPQKIYDEFYKPSPSLPERVSLLSTAKKANIISALKNLSNFQASIIYSFLAQQGKQEEPDDMLDACTYPDDVLDGCTYPDENRPS